MTPVVPVSPAVPSTETTKTASPATLVEEITTPISKRLRLTDKRKEKVDSYLSSVWDDVGLAMERAHEVITVKDRKIFSGVPSKEVVARHVHKIVQVVYLCNFSPFFFFYRPEGFSFHFRCWGRALISPRSTSLKKQRSGL